MSARIERLSYCRSLNELGKPSKALQQVNVAIIILIKIMMRINADKRVRGSGAARPNVSFLNTAAFRPLPPRPVGAAALLLFLLLLLIRLRRLRCEWVNRNTQQTGQSNEGFNHLRLRRRRPFKVSPVEEEAFSCRWPSRAGPAAAAARWGASTLERAAQPTASKITTTTWPSLQQIFVPGSRSLSQRYERHISSI